jgi:hypothetical protein
VFGEVAEPKHAPKVLKPSDLRHRVCEACAVSQLVDVSKLPIDFGPVLACLVYPSPDAVKSADNAKPIEASKTRDLADLGAVVKFKPHLDPFASHRVSKVASVPPVSS